MKTTNQTIGTLALLVVAVTGQSCDDISSDEYITEGNDRVYTSEPGYYKNRRTWYWEFGPRNPAVGPSDDPGSVVGTAPIWVLTRENGDSAGNNIIDVLPCEDGYSDLWQVVEVTVDDSIEENSLTSREDVEAAIEAGNATSNTTEDLVNCPVVPLGSTLSDASPADRGGDVPSVTGWYQGVEVLYFDFGTVSSTDTEPVWILSTENGDSAGLNLIDVIPGDEGYTPFWQVVNVTVPNDTEQESITSAATVAEEDFETENTTDIVNCPVSFTEDEEIDDADSDGGDGVSTDAGAAVTVSFGTVAMTLVAVAVGF